MLYNLRNQRRWYKKENFGLDQKTNKPSFETLGFISHHLDSYSLGNYFLIFIEQIKKLEKKMTVKLRRMQNKQKIFFSKDSTKDDILEATCWICFKNHIFIYKIEKKNLENTISKKCDNCRDRFIILNNSK
jgi:hypothetical protein